MHTPPSEPHRGMKSKTGKKKRQLVREQILMKVKNWLSNPITALTRLFKLAPRELGRVWNGDQRPLCINNRINFLFFPAKTELGRMAPTQPFHPLLNGRWPGRCCLRDWGRTTSPYLPQSYRDPLESRNSLNSSILSLQPRTPTKDGDVQSEGYRMHSSVFQ